jgi:hypothetical protein
MAHLADIDKGVIDRSLCIVSVGKSIAWDRRISEVKAVRMENEYLRKENEYRARTRTGRPLPWRTNKAGALVPLSEEACLRLPAAPPSRCVRNAWSPTDGPGCATGSGDPHLKTFDNLFYDFQAVGEFVLTRASGTDLEVQGRTSALGGMRTVSLFSAVAANVAGDRVGVYVTPGGLQIHIGGKAEVVPIGVRHLPKGGTVELFGDGRLEIRWPDGSALWVRVPGIDLISLSLELAEARRGQVEGLFGNFDGEPKGDLVVRSGTNIGEEPSFETLYRTFGNSWRVTRAGSLFDYGPGESTETFTDLTFPDKAVAAADLPNRATAEAVCRQAGVTEPKLLEGCILDVGLTGEIAFAHDAVTIQRLVATGGASPSQSSVAAPPNAGVTTEEIVGHWYSVWGDQLMRVVGNEIRGTYSHDEGTVVVRWDSDGVLRGWWCEVPSRAPAGDAGEVEYRFTKANGVVKVDGRWRYGVTGSWSEDWDLDHVTTRPPAELTDRFNNPAAFCRHP